LKLEKNFHDITAKRNAAHQFLDCSPDELEIDPGRFQKWKKKLIWPALLLSFSQPTMKGWVRKQTIDLWPVLCISITLLEWFGDCI